MFSNIENVSAQTIDDEMMGEQVSVEQLSDVKPTDWAYESLKNLSERYNCLTSSGGKPNLFEGDRVLTRYEFADGLNLCLQQMEKLIGNVSNDFIKKDDLSQLGRLNKEFQPELTAIQNRLDQVESKTAKLEGSQFSTTTKLFGQTIFGLQGRLENTTDLNPRDGTKDVRDTATNITFGQNTQLTLVTQFSDRSMLLTGLQMGNTSTGITDFTSNNFLSNTYTRLGYELNTGNNVQLSDLSYRFAVGKNVAVIVGAEGVNAINVFRGPNRVESAGQGPISAFAQRNPIIGIGGGRSGVGFDWQLNKKISLQGIYSAGDPANSSPNSGFFNGPITTGLQLALTPTDQVDLAVYYLRSYTTNASLNTGVGDNLIGPIEGRFTTNAIGGTVTWQVSPKLTVGGWGGYTSSEIKNPGLSGGVETVNWMAFVNFPDLFKNGNLGGIYIGQPPKITSSDLASGGVSSFNLPSAIGLPGVVSGAAGGQPDTTLHLEAFYRMQLTENISVTPGILMLINPVHTSGSDTITIGSLRTTFSF